MEYPTYLIYANSEEVKAKLKRIQLVKQRKMLNKCDGLQVVEINGEPMAAVDMKVYQYLVRFLMQQTEIDSKDLK